MPTIKSGDVTKAHLEDCFAKLELSLFFHFILAVILSYKISEGINTYRYYSLLNLPCFLNGWCRKQLLPVDPVPLDGVMCLGGCHVELRYVL